MTNLIFIEGVSGAGKSTAVKALAEKLCKMGFSAVHYTEGDTGNPIDFYCVAYFSINDYESLLNNYTEIAEIIKIELLSLMMSDWYVIMTVKFRCSMNLY